ncbi:MAG: c-type cytochrome [Candidatus Sulfopaludibacter sp.]|nr:c-type cytochrome [Candidatus Sulfopaludibacter sp.]
MFKPFLLLSAVAIFVLVPASAPAGPPQEKTPAASAQRSSAKPSAQLQAKAKEIYQIDCALCHGANGDGKTDVAKDMGLSMADWTDPKSLAGMQDQVLFDTIRNGKGKMPAEAEGRASKDVVTNLIAYIRNLSKGQPAPAEAPTPAPTPAPAESAPATPPASNN